MPRSPPRARRRGRRYIEFGSWLSVSRKPGYLVGRRLSVDDMATLLFVCVENTFRSVLSEALFNASAAPGWRAESAGVQAATAINPAVIGLLQEIGIRLGPKTPRPAPPAWRSSVAADGPSTPSSSRSSSSRTIRD